MSTNVFVIITVQASSRGQLMLRTFQGEVTVKPTTTARELYDYVWQTFVPREMHTTGVVLYYSATPNQPWADGTTS